MPSVPVFVIAAGMVGVLLLVVVPLVLRRGGSSAGQMSETTRSNLLHNGLRAQATITAVRVVGGGRSYVTTASGIDPASGHPKIYTQQSIRSIGRRGEPVTVLVDPARPQVYLIVA